MVRPAQPQVRPAVAPIALHPAFPPAVDGFSPALAKRPLVNLGGAGPVTGPMQAGGRTQITTYADLVNELKNHTLQNADVRVPLDLSILRSYRDPGHPNEKYDQWVARIRADPNFASATAANKDLLDAIAANPTMNWNGLFERQDLSGTTFYGKIDYANFYRATGTNVTFNGPINDGWFGSADFDHPKFFGGVTGSDFTGTTLTNAQFTGTLKENAFNGSNLAGADFICVASGTANDFQFARLDNAHFGMATKWGTSDFTGAVTTGATNPPAASATLPAIDLSGAVAKLGGAQVVQDLAAKGQLLPALVKLGEPYASAVNQMLPESWRSYLADGLGDGGHIKAEVYNAVDGRYSGRTPSFIPTLANLHANTIDPRAAQLIDQKLAEMMTTPGMKLDDPMGLKGSATGRSFHDWVAHVTGTEVSWTGHPGTSDNTPSLAEFTVPRETLQELYARMKAAGFEAEAEKLRLNLDNFDSFKLGDLLASQDYPQAQQILYEIYGG
jgi:hypothetical protein